MPFIQWDDILNVSIGYREELKTLGLILVIMFSLQFVLQLINTINLAHQKVFLTSLRYSLRPTWRRFTRCMRTGQGLLQRLGALAPKTDDGIADFHIRLALRRIQHYIAIFADNRNMNGAICRIIHMLLITIRLGNPGPVKFPAFRKVRPQAQ